MANFKKYFKFPLKMWENMSIKVFTAENNMAFDWLINIPKEIKEAFVAIINGERKANYQVKKEFYHKNDGIIYCKMLEGDKEGSEYKLLRIRGWGMLTGVGGFHLDPDMAAQMQDDFMNYCVEKLNG